MYKKIVNIFFNELKSDNLLNIPNDFYDNLRIYLNTIYNNPSNERISELDLKRVLYYIKELRKLRLYKAFFGDRTNLVDEEKKLLSLIEDITLNPPSHFNLNNNNSDISTYNLMTINNGDNPSNSRNNIKMHKVLGPKLDDNSVKQYIEYTTPKPINTQNNIDIVRVNKRFPEFTDGRYSYTLNKNDIVTLDKKFSKILEKHNIVKKISNSGE